MKQIDVRGLSCPAPVLEVKTMIDNGEAAFEVLCDCGASVENIGRFAINAKYAFSFKEMSDKSILISLQKA